MCYSVGDILVSLKDLDAKACTVHFAEKKIETKFL